MNIFERFPASWSFLSNFADFWRFSDVFGRLELFLFGELSLSSIHYVLIHRGLHSEEESVQNPKSQTVQNNLAYIFHCLGNVGEIKSN